MLKEKSTQNRNASLFTWSIPWVTNTKQLTPHSKTPLKFEKLLMCCSQFNLIVSVHSSLSNLKAYLC